jgi:3'-5' exoribonuclease
VKFHHLVPGQPADSFALLSDRSKRLTRDGKPFYVCRFQDKVRALEAIIWSDHPLYPDCEEGWPTGQIYRVQGTVIDHPRYGLQFELRHLRAVRDHDRNEGFAEQDFYERTRFDPEMMFQDLQTLVSTEIRDEPLRRLVTTILTTHAEALQRLPADPKRYYPFVGGWLEHTLSVTRSCIMLADKYCAHYSELTPPLNRDVIVAGAILHEIGRVAELHVTEPEYRAEPTLAGHLFGHQILGRDMIRAAAQAVPDLNPEFVTLLEHVLLSHLTRPEWGSVRQPLIPEVLLIHHADDLDAKLETYIRCLIHDPSVGPLTEKDPVIGRPLLKARSV